MLALSLLSLDEDRDITKVMDLQNNNHLEQLALFKAIFDQLSEAVYIIEPDTSMVIDVNQAGCDDLGKSREEVLNHSVLSLQRDAQDGAHWSSIVAAIREAGTFVFVGLHQRKDGSEFPVEVHTSYFCHSGEELLVSIARDITERVALEDAQKAQDPQLQYMMNAASDGLWDWNMKTDDVFFSPQLKRMLGYAPHEMVPHLSTWVNNVHPDDLERVGHILQVHLEGRSIRYEAEYRLRTRNGDYIWVHDHGAVCERDEQSEPTRIIGVLHNVSEQKALEDKLRKAAAYDELTGLLNRRAGYDQFRKTLSNAQRHQQVFAVALLDLDHFKHINDSCGHLVGDKVLRTMAGILSRELREYDVLLRWGGEEFLLLMPNTCKEDAFVLCDRLRAAIAEEMRQCESGCMPTLSGGIATYPESGTTIEELVRSADGAMYQAKRQGRNQIQAQLGPTA